MKTLHLTNFWHSTSGGISTFYRALIRAANEEQRPVRMIVPSDATRVEQVGRYGRIYHIQSPRAPFNREYRILLPHRFLIRGSAVQNILRVERPDLVEICDKYSINYLGAFLREQWLGLNYRPTVIGLSCERMDDNVSAYLSTGARARALSRFYMRVLYFPMFDHHVTVSDYTAGELLDASVGHRTERAVWVRPMGVDLEGFSPANRSPARPSVRDVLSVLCQESLVT